jgi:flagellar motor switch protein FliM
MTEKTLTANEIDDLLSVFKGGHKGAESLSDVESLDLDRPNRIPRGILETLEIRHEQAARLMREGLRVALGKELQLSLLGLEQERFQTFKERQEEPCCGFVIDMPPLRSPAYLVMDFAFAFACIDRLLGGTGSDAGSGRELTATEVSVLSEVIEAVLRAHVVVWDRYTKLTPTLRKTVSIPRFMRDIRDEDAMLTAEYRFKDFVDGGGFRLSMPLPGLEGRLQFGGDREPTEDEGATDQVRGELQEHMVDVDVDVSVRIGGADITVGDILALEAGDVVLLDRDVKTQLDLLVEGRPKFGGRLLRKGRKLVFRVDGESPASQRESSNES